MILQLLLASTLLAAGASPQPESEFATVEGRISSLVDGAFLPGAEVQILSMPSGRVVARVISDDRGNYSASGLAAGRYRVSASLDGFQPTDSETFDLPAGGLRQVDLALPIQSLEESVEVVGSRQADETGTSIESVEGEVANIAPVKGDDFSDLLPLLPGVIRGVDGRLVMNGGRPTQSSYVINNSTNVTDPSSGNLGFTLPSDAVESVDVLANPYAAEFGRFSSGITNILTRQGTNKWRFLVNNFFPRAKLRDGTIMGIGGFTPRFQVRGPLVKDRLFLSQTVQYRYLIDDVPSLPELESDTRLESFSSFTQLDAQFNDSHNLTTFVSVFPRKLDFVNLDTFNPRPVTPNLHERGYQIGLSERFVIDPSVVLESTVSVKDYDVDIFGQGLGEMFLNVEENSGDFFNIQRRRTRSWQWVESLSIYKDWAGQHLFKFGVDLLNASYDGLSDSRPVNVTRQDGTLSQRITFSPAASQRVRNTDLAFFAQDRWRLSDRLLLEFGARIDRDGVFERTNFAPRFGFAIGVLPAGKGIVKGGAGLFYDRVPLTVEAFPDFERRTVTRFAPDGLTPLGTPVTFRHQLADDLRTPYSFTWNVEYDHRLRPNLLLKTNFLRRQGNHEIILDPLDGNDPRLRLDSRGRSRYWELELTSRWNYSEKSFLIASYVRSESEQDLNDFDQFFGNFRDPIIRPNEYSFADSDVSNRLLLQGTWILPDDWIFSPVLEWRDGFPFSARDEDRFFVGPRNRAGRFPNLVTLDVDLQRWFTIKGIRARIGIRIFNIFNTFTPRDVQNIVDSPRFGTFFNTNERIFGGTFQIEP
ncbi:MAG TPA: carboxypeptidase regulatory-like domain-containing protein [Acidobacteriota bacterium]|nr:carboxypeptidase regulatory-like domain-containing protein [Acidobacteriota bacterium]